MPQASLAAWSSTCADRGFTTAQRWPQWVAADRVPRGGWRVPEPHSSLPPSNYLPVCDRCSARTEPTTSSSPPIALEASGQTATKKAPAAAYTPLCVSWCPSPHPSAALSPFVHNHGIPTCVLSYKIVSHTATSFIPVCPFLSASVASPVHRAGDPVRVMMAPTCACVCVLDSAHFYTTLLKICSRYTTHANVLDAPAPHVPQPHP